MAKITNRVTMVPDIDDSLDLGETEQRFRDVYIAGHLTDGVDSVAVGDIPAMANGSLTETSVPFVDANGKLTESANLNWVDEDSRLNIGVQSEVSHGPQWPFFAAASNEDYTGIGVQNLSNGAGASTDISASADNDNPSLIGHYIDVGINSSTYDGSTVGYIGTVSVAAGGTGYTVSDVLTLSSGNYNGEVIVETVGVDGEVLTVSISKNGTGYVVEGSIPVTGGTGSACFINVDTLIDNSLLTPNAGYLYNSGGDLVIGLDNVDAESVMKFYIQTPATNNNQRQVMEHSATTTKLNLLTTNGYVKTSGGDGTLTVDTTTLVSESLAIAYAVAL